MRLVVSLMLDLFNKSTRTEGTQLSWNADSLMFPFPVLGVTVGKRQRRN